MANNSRDTELFLKLTDAVLGQKDPHIVRSQWFMYQMGHNFELIKEILFNHYPYLEIFPEMHESSYIQNFLQTPVESRVLSHLPLLTDLDRTRFEAREFYSKNLGVTPRQILEISEKIKSNVSNMNQSHLSQLYNTLKFLIASKNLTDRNLLLPELPLINFLHDLGLNFVSFRQRGMGPNYNREIERNLEAGIEPDFFIELTVILSLYAPEKYGEFLHSVKGASSLFSDTISQIRRNVVKFSAELKQLPFREKSTIVKLHDVVSEMYLKETTPEKKLNQSLNNPYLCRLTEISFSNPSLKVVIPESSYQLADWGRKLRICVGSYADMIIKNETIVVGITEDNAIKYCIELIDPAMNYIRSFRFMGRIGNFHPSIPKFDLKYTISQFKGLQNIDAPHQIREEFESSRTFAKFERGVDHWWNLPEPQKLMGLFYDVKAQLIKWQIHYKKYPSIWENSCLKPHIETIQFADLIDIKKEHLFPTLLTKTWTIAIDFDEATKPRKPNYAA